MFRLFYSPVTTEQPQSLKKYLIVFSEYIKFISVFSKIIFLLSFGFTLKKQISFLSIPTVICLEKF